VDRYYDPSTDQFLTVDPDLAETGQAYAFTGDDPLNATDPLGLKKCKKHTCSPPTRHLGKKTAPKSILQLHPKVTSHTGASKKKPFNGLPSSITDTPGFNAGVSADKQTLFNNIDCHGQDNGLTGGEGCDVVPNDASYSVTQTTYQFSSTQRVVQTTENVVVNYDLITTDYASGLPDDNPGGSAQFEISLGYKQYVGDQVVAVNSLNEGDL
jgi:hypothetical protein